jgi:hypothetical protein
MNDIRQTGILIFKTMDEWYYEHTADVINDTITAMLKNRFIENGGL